MKSKKIIAVLSAFAIFGAGTLTGSALTSFTADAENSMNFDVNGDGSVNVNDITYLKNYIFKNIEDREIPYNFGYGGISSCGGGYGVDGNYRNDEFIISSYDEFLEFASNCYEADIFSETYDEEFFKENSLLTVCIETDAVNTYDFCSLMVEDNVLTLNLDITMHYEYEYYGYGTDFLLFEYKKSDFSGTECCTNRSLHSYYEGLPEPDKPVIYLYPEEETDVNVKLDFNGELTFTYPEYPENTGWNVTAMPDGILYDENGLEYSYLFWEGKSNVQYDMSEGFVVKGEDTVEFLQEKLAYMGLTPKEYNEFIVYWTPRMQNNKYNLISFQSDVYTDNAVLEVTPKPDSMLRVFMAFKPLDEYVEIPEQKLETFERKGFAVVEWGGAEMKNSDLSEIK